MDVLHVYAAEWCPHCRNLIKWLDAKGIKYYYHEVEAQPQSILEKIIAVNGGDDWAVPTLMFNDKWAAAVPFVASEYEKRLTELGVI